VVSLVLGKVA